MNIDQFKKQLINKFSASYTPEQTELFTKAIDFAIDHHDGQLRESGEPYITHPFQVAKIVLDLGMDAESIIAAILHDSVEDCKGVTLEEVEHEFGKGVAMLVDGVTKLTKSAKNEYITKKQEQVENLRKLFLSIASDVRVVIIKLADRLHNMRTLSYCSREKQMRVSKETLEVYAPLAHRFGMGAIKGELEDLSFMYLYPDEYRATKEAFSEKKREREILLNTTMQQISEKIMDAGINGTINGRPKHLYSVYRKLQRQNCTINEIYDLIAIRVIVDTVNDCYATLGVLHANWKPFPGRFKDYIATPKPNMYRSLHTTLLGANGIPFEVQIRTVEMHRTAEYGIAAHWMYKEGRNVQSDLDRKTSWIRQVLETKDTTENSSEFVESILKDFLGEYVFVLSPKGEIFDLPKGSTVLDFAYRIHTNVGHHCTRAKVNGSIVKLDYKLKTNDMVEIITSKSQQGPSRDWLKIVKTQSARNRIKQWFKKENREENIVRGREMIEDSAKRANQDLTELLHPDIYEPVLERLNMSTLDDFYAAVGFGGITSMQALHKLIDQAVKLKKKTAPQVKQNKGQGRGSKTTATNGIIVYGDPGMAVRFGNCCNPLPGDPIIGYITRGRGVSVHKKDCPNIASLTQDSDRLIDVEWAVNTESSFEAALQIHADNRPGTLLEISALLSGLDINIVSINGRPMHDGSKYVVEMTFDVKNSSQMETVVTNLKKLKCVYDVYRQYK
ncbi:MAG: bifunctional (p)ppGpp synthetase/guanosine-3',5'-bis(diphosphate) 3'-pyrophosphohydrolase [Clostridiales bacterium]|nr:bifunctional (p)ppGpp synthetase/guanosine-3',5'-bis(diphosphate) 3'-pyrophosphohydrolase [Clostridiales bacterium]